ncbi:hypothetical protein [Micromonospora sp. KC213]|nr:hypothetical protein [Micromonospora sp. KC213]
MTTTVRRREPDMLPPPTPFPDDDAAWIIAWARLVVQRQPT